MSNFIGDLFWNYLGKYLEMITKIPETLVTTLAKGAIAEAKREIALKSLDETQFKTPEIRDAVRKLKESWQHSPEGAADIARDILLTVTGRQAQVQLEEIAGVTITDTDKVTSEMFAQLGLITDISVLANTLKIIGSLIPTTNAQYIGIAIDDYISSSGQGQIVGFGYGMLFSNIVSPLVTYELNKKVRPTLIDPLSTIQAEYKQFLTKAQSDEMLAKHGYSDIYQDTLRKNFLFYPGAMDFIRFAVRETFRPDIVAKYGYDNEYPVDIDPYVLKAGLSHDWMIHYWRSHWELPAPNMGFEMLHRSLITMDELKTLLAIADYAPFWRDKIIGISYSPYTRVDTRRLYVDGVIDRDAVKRNYLDIGYDEIHAENLTAWTCKEISAEKKVKIKDLTEAAVTRAYNFGQLSETEYLTQLKVFGYDDDESKTVKALADYQSFEDELTSEWKIVKAYYVAGLKNEPEIRARLDMLKLSQKEQDKWIRQLDREKELIDIAAEVKAQTAKSKTVKG